MPPSSSRDALSPETQLCLLVRRSAAAHEGTTTRRARERKGYIKQACTWIDGRGGAPVAGRRFVCVAAAAGGRAGGRRTDKQGRRLEVYNEVLARLRTAGGTEISPAFEDALWEHFHCLPAR
ncbi:hypothetical protein ZWY2020_022305 [Hordeum vulgare]|nr:hypothetical protein ZWY2020_022305 [Hordeum vulgare]